MSGKASPQLTTPSIDSEKSRHEGGHSTFHGKRVALVWSVLLVGVALLAYTGGRLHHSPRIPEVHLQNGSEVHLLTGAQFEEKNKHILEALTALQNQQNRLELKLASRETKPVSSQMQGPSPASNKQLSQLLQEVEKLKELVVSLASTQLRHDSKKVEAHDQQMRVLSNGLSKVQTTVDEVKLRADIIMKRIPARQELLN